MSAAAKEKSKLPNTEKPTQPKNLANYLVIARIKSD